MIGALFATVGLSESVLNEELRPSPHIAAYYQTWSAEAGPLLDETLVNLPIGLTRDSPGLRASRSRLRRRSRPEQYRT